MSNSDSDTDSSTSTESTLTINTSDYEDLTDLDSLYSSDCLFPIYSCGFV